MLPPLKNGDFALVSPLLKGGEGILAMLLSLSLLNLKASDMLTLTLF